MQFRRPLKRSHSCQAYGADRLLRCTPAVGYPPSLLLYRFVSRVHTLLSKYSNLCVPCHVACPYTALPLSGTPLISRRASPHHASTLVPRLMDLCPPPRPWHSCLVRARRTTSSTSSSFRTIVHPRFDLHRLQRVVDGVVVIMPSSPTSADWNGEECALNGERAGSLVTLGATGVLCLVPPFRIS